MGKYTPTYGFPSTYSENEQEGILLRILIQILMEVEETNRLLRLGMQNPNKGQTSTDNVSATL